MSCYMSSRQLIALVLSLPLILGCSAFCQDGYSHRARKDERFEARRGEVTAEAAKAAYLRTLSNLKAAPSNDVCQERQRERCGDRLYATPFPPALSSSDLASRSGWKNPDEIRDLVPEGYFSWAPVETVAGANDLIKQYRLLANSGTLFACAGDGEHECNFITSATSQPNLLVVCYVEERDDPPSGCSPLLLSDGGRQWIAIVSRRSGEEGGPADDYLIQILTRGPGLEPKILNLLAQGLSSSTLGLRVSASTGGFAGLKGLSEYRASSVLPGWREYVVLRIDVDQVLCVEDPTSPTNKGAPSPYPYCLRYSSQLWVNRQNSDSPSDWHRPSDAQEKSYELNVARTIRQSLNQLCAAPSWRTENILRCD